MKEIVELDEDDIIRALSLQITREKDWGELNAAGVVTLIVTAGTPPRVTARIEKLHESRVSLGKLVSSNFER